MFVEDFGLEGHLLGKVADQPHLHMPESEDGRGGAENRSGGLGAPSLVPGCVKICVCGLCLRASVSPMCRDSSHPTLQVNGKILRQSATSCEVGGGGRAPGARLFTVGVSVPSEFWVPCSLARGGGCVRCRVRSGWVCMTGSGGGREHSCVWGMRGLGSQCAHMGLCHPPA